MGFKILVIVLGGALTAGGLGQFIRSWYYGDIAGREATAVGTLQSASDGSRGWDFEFSLQHDGRSFHSFDRQCTTPSNHGDCKAGDPVTVYFDPSNPDRSMLNEFGAESRSHTKTVAWMLPAGLILLLLVGFDGRIGQKREPS